MDQRNTRHAVTIDTSPSPSDRHPNAVSAVVRCGQCAYAIFTWVPNGEPSASIIDCHTRQHEPGRALDIEVEWHVTADCSVCDDGGEVEVDPDGDLTCEKCGTYWSIEGRGGTRNDEDPR